MDDKVLRILHWRIRWQAAVLRTISVFYCIILVRLAIRNLQALQNYRREVRNLYFEPYSIVELLRDRYQQLRDWLTFPRYIRLFLVLPSLSHDVNEDSQQLLRKLHREMHHAYIDHGFSLRKGTCPRATQLQRRAVKCAFDRYIGISLSEGDLEVLKYSNNVCSLIWSFLDFCVCGRRPLAFYRLEGELPLYIQKIQQDQQTLLAAARDGSHNDAIEIKIDKFVYRLYWARTEARERSQRYRQLNRAQREEHLKRIMVLQEKTPMRQASLRDLIAFEMYLRALRLADVEAGRFVQSGFIWDCVAHDVQFSKMLDRLDGNLGSFCGTGRTSSSPQRNDSRY